ncbi:MAG TPA: tRNA uridine-5-carboxymethylaminomethyl(34) synthesis GTPase MnmE, partial [Bacteroidota bacterium]|nr:tRNA uridine-5-carboxymethylaminomethyl(34) synthesis GTPase MnmE [Bacteroidota bacterium]
MSLLLESDTIAAVATPVGEGGIAVIRLSGAEALRIADRGFRGRGPLASVSTHTAHYGKFVDRDEAAIDNVVALVFRNPNSYTGEDVVEISCHGGQFLVARILEALLSFGARAAAPGEFTKRAFLNGRLDLAQAEAVSDLIRSRSDRAHQASLSQLDGALSNKITALRGQLVDSLGLLELELDFAEDGYEFTEKSRVEIQLESVIAELDQLISSYRTGKLYRDGVQVALAGAPNVGKSSLLNAFLKEERAIVTNIPGTTRDIIEEAVTLDGVLFVLSDTAGLRETTDPIEQEGVRRAEEKLRSCDILLLMLDPTRPLDKGEAAQSIKLISEVESRGATCIIAINKVDLEPTAGDVFSDLSEILSNHTVLRISAT